MRRRFSTRAESLASNPYDGVLPSAQQCGTLLWSVVCRIDPTHQKIPAQLDEVVARTEGRTIDALLLSAGANDVGFSNIVTGCLNGPSGFLLWYDCSTPGSAAQLRAEECITSRLPGLYDQLPQAIRVRLHPRRVLITEYPDVTRDENGNMCDPLMVTPLGRISRAEAQWAYDHVITGMNQAITSAADRNTAAGWEVVWLGDAFSRGGHCSNSGRLIRTLMESEELQGNKMGTLHPNAGGHTAIALRVLQRLDAPAAAQ